MMISSIFQRPAALLGIFLVAGSLAGPVDVSSTGARGDLAIVERFSSISLGTYNLATTHENDVLFDVVASAAANSARLKVECVDCRTWGTAVVTTSGVTKHEDIIGEIDDFFKRPIDTILSAFDLDIKISFDDCGGYFGFDILAIDTVTYSIPIFSSDIISGIMCSEDVTIGLGVFVDLVFSLTAGIDLGAGFEVAFPEGAYITVDPLSGDIVDHNFTGGSVQHLPIEVRSGAAVFNAALRVRIQAGTTVEVFGTGFDFELGVSADLIEYEATLAPSSSCDLSITESIDVNIGAYAHAVVDVDYKSFGAMPAVVTTILDVALPSFCLVEAAGPTDTLYTAPGGAASVMESTAVSSAIGSASILPSTVPTAVTAIVTSASTVSAVEETSTGGVFFQGSSSSTRTTTSRYHNSTVTSASALVTSTVWTTDLITVTSCAANVLHCPVSQASEVIITSTKVLYTTVCPAGQLLPSSTFLAASSSSSGISAQATTAVPVTASVPVIRSGLPLTPCKTTSVSTVYTPTIGVPTYSIPTATTFAGAYPNWNFTTSSSSGYVFSAGSSNAVGTTSSVLQASSISSTVGSYPSTSTSSTSSVQFTGAATHLSAPPKAVKLAGWAVLVVYFLI